MAIHNCVRFCVDFSLLLAVGIPILLFFLLGVPYERGFYCDDESLRYPYKDSTVSTVTLYLVGTLLPVISVSLCGRDLGPWFWAIYCNVFVFLFGCACSQLSTDVAKYTIGRLRPHFVDVCKPDWSKVNCTVGVYVYPIPCTGEDEHRMKEARLSFPSGHASFSAFTMIYLMIYLNYRLYVKSFRFVRPVFQLICFLITFYTSLSRVSDNKHHWSDVFFGFCLGFVVAVLIAHFVSDFCSPDLLSVSPKEQLRMRDVNRQPEEGGGQ